MGEEEEAMTTLGFYAMQRRSALYPSSSSRFISQPLSSHRLEQQRRRRRSLCAHREMSTQALPASSSSYSSWTDLVAYLIWPVIFPALGGYMLSQVIGAAWLEHRSKALRTTTKAAATSPVLPCVDFILLDDDDDDDESNP